MLTVLLLVLLLAVIALAAVPDEPAKRDGLLMWWLPEPNRPADAAMRREESGDIGSPSVPSRDA